MFDLLPWRKRPGSDLMGFKSEMDNLFNRFFELDFPMSRDLMKTGAWAPRIDISDNGNQITIKAEIPGCDVKDIDIEIDGRLLTIKGEKKHEKEEKEKHYLRAERAHGRFSRTIELSADVDQEAVDAAYRKGVLTVVLDKTTSPQGKRIEIKTS